MEFIRGWQELGLHGSRGDGGWREEERLFF